LRFIRGWHVEFVIQRQMQTLENGALIGITRYESRPIFATLE
jgi:hypothetical protein